jgi:hypothetical protein
MAAGLASAQPTIDQTCAPTVGSSYAFVVADALTLPGIGAGQTWNASGAMITGSDNVDFIGLGNSSAGASYPAADVVLTAAGNETYIDVASDGLYILGSYNSSLPITSIYTNVYQYLQFPCTLGTAWTDTYAGSYTYNSITYAQSGTGSYEATGYGSLVLPWGTVDNVLRIDGTENYQESGNGNSYDYNATFSYFYKPGIGYFVAKGIDASAELNGAPAGTQQNFLYLEAGSIGMAEHAAATIGVELFPNPAQDQATLVYTAEGSVSLEVLDAAGRTVAHRAIARSGAGLFREMLDVSALTNGLYTAIITSADGQRGVARFLVER